MYRTIYPCSWQNLFGKYWPYNYLFLYHLFSRWIKIPFRKFIFRKLKRKLFMPGVQVWLYCPTSTDPANKESYLNFGSICELPEDVGKKDTYCIIASGQEFLRHIDDIHIAAEPFVYYGNKFYLFDFYWQFIAGGKRMVGI